MNLQEFVKDVIIQLDAAIDEVNQTTARKVSFSEKEGVRTVEFDIAVSVESNSQKSGKAGIKVLEFAEAGGDISAESKNSSVSRITFGLRVDSMTRVEERELHDRARQANQSRLGSNGFSSY